MSRARSTIRKKKAVAAILLVLCAAMLALILVVRFQPEGSTGGGGAMFPENKEATEENATEGASEPTSVEPVDEKPAQQVREDAGEEAPVLKVEDSVTEDSRPKSEQGDPTEIPSTLVSDVAEIPVISKLTWQPYDQNKVVYFTHRVKIFNHPHEVVLTTDLPATIFELNLGHLGLEENQRYWYEIAPVTREEVDLSDNNQVALQQGSFYLNLEDESPTKPVIQYPGNGCEVDSFTPNLEWAESTDKDPYDNVTYRVRITDNSGKSVWNIETDNPHAILDKKLEENQTYTLTVVAVDKTGNESDPATATFSVDTRADRPTEPSGLYSEEHDGDQGIYLAWRKSADPNPGNSVVGYSLVVQDAETGEETKLYSGNNAEYFKAGVYGHAYKFRVTAKNDADQYSKTSGWSKPFIFPYNYDYVPELTRPKTDKQRLTGNDGLEWTKGPDVARYEIEIGSVKAESETNSLPLRKFVAEAILLAGETYEVKVRAVSIRGVVTQYSDNRLFILNNTMPKSLPAPICSNGDGRADDTNREDTLSWPQAEDIDQDQLTYEVQVALDKEFANPQFLIKTEKTTVEFGAFWDSWRKLDEKKIYYIRIVTLDPAGNRSMGEPLAYYNAP